MSIYDDMTEAELAEFDREAGAMSIYDDMTEAELAEFDREMYRIVTILAAEEGITIEAWFARSTRHYSQVVLEAKGGTITTDQLYVMATALDPEFQHGFLHDIEKTL